MADYALPNFTRRPQSVVWGFEANGTAHRSPGTGIVQTQSLPGGRWITTITWRLAAETEARVMEAWIAKLDGMANRALLWNMRRELARGALGGTPLVAGAGQTGMLLNIDGATPGVTNWLREGDMVGLGGYLYMSAADVNTDGAGAATLTLRPGLRGVPADNAPLTFVRPTARFMLTAQRQLWTAGPGVGSIEFTLDFEEDPR